MKQVSLVLSLVCVVCFLLVSCDKAPPTMAVNDEQLILVAKDYITQHRPEWQSELGLPPLVTDKGSYWEVTFALPPDTLGGTPVVHIDKQSVKVTKCYHTQ